MRNRILKNSPAFLFLIFIVALILPLLSINVAGTKFSNPLKTIKVKAGRGFAIVLKSNHSQGYKWQISKPLSESILRFLRSEYKEPIEEYLKGSGGEGEEIWLFKADKKGITKIPFQYVRSSQKGPELLIEKSFTVIIN